MEIIKKLRAIQNWPDPKPGAGEGLGALAGTGMYMQYDADRKLHHDQIEEIINSIIHHKIGANPSQKIQMMVWAYMDEEPRTRDGTKLAQDIIDLIEERYGY